MRTYVLFLQLIIGCLILPASGLTQPVNWDVNISKPRNYASLNPSDDPRITEKEMWQVSLRNLMSLTKDELSMYGIDATLHDKRGFAELSVYLLDTATIKKDEKKGRGPLLFRCRTDSSIAPKRGNIPIKYDLDAWSSWWKLARTDSGYFYFNEFWNSNDPRSPVFEATTFNYNKRFAPFKRKGNMIIPINDGPNADLQLPVIIELKIYKANVKLINVPGIGFIEPGYFKPAYMEIDAVTTKIGFNDLTFKLDVNVPTYNAIVKFSDISINLSPFGNTDPSKILAKRIIKADQVPYIDDNFNLKANTILAQELWVWASYDIEVRDDRGKDHVYPNQQQYLFSYVGQNTPVQQVFEIKQDKYQDLPVYTLSGGMSAEYGIEKALASLSSGISETWDVRDINGEPDLKDGGPVSIYPDATRFDFLKQAVNQTVKVYDQYLGANTTFETVIIGTGVANLPYLANAMKAPYLPLHFLVSIHSVAEVKRVLDTANAHGLPAFSMLGYDPSIKDIAVAWIKLQELPAAYIEFIKRHKVKNIIIMGYSEGTGGEIGAKRIWIEGQTDEDYSPGSMYMMGHGEEGTYKDLYRDYDYWNMGEEKITLDWEGGLTNTQVINFSKVLPAPDFNTYVLETDNSANFYRWAVDVQLLLLKKNKQKPVEISMNEYLIGYPEYELWRGIVPYLYWQGIDSTGKGLLAYTVNSFGGYKMKDIFPQGIGDVPVYMPAKADREAISDSLCRYFKSVTMGKWQKADIWDPADGMESYCELTAQYIVTQPGGAKAFADWNNKRAVLDFNDFNVMMQNSIKPPPNPDPNLFPNPDKITELKKIDEAGMVINQFDFDQNTYWQPPNYPQSIDLRSMASGFPGKILGYLDGQEAPPIIRKQSIAIASFDLTNNSDEYDLKMAYKFNVSKKDGLSSYDPKLGEEQNMDCFEFTSIPFNHWMDIPSRMMARSGAVMILNGGVYDFDYNGIPGVVPFIKKNGEIKAQPQILSFKGEAAFAWNWGTSKQVKIISREKDIPATGLAPYLSQLFRRETLNYKNVMGAMTFMKGNDVGRELYDITALQPDWMKNYPPFPPYYLKADRCFFAPLSLNCGGTEIVAPIDDGWGDCSTLKTDNAIQRFSTLAYRQYPRTFDDVPNARTFIALKGSQLDIGIINGDYGDKKSYRGPVLTKSIGMHVYEESQFVLKKGYDQFVNLDGGSSTQMWVNGRGPLHMLNSYVLSKDNQGPYYSRLLSSFVMLVPKLHTELIRQNVQPAHVVKIPALDNRKINFNYSDAKDVEKNKAFIDLSPCKDSLNKKDDSYGIIAGNFFMSAINIFENKHGGILFYTGEDMYYPDTRGLDVVEPRLRNLMVIGVGMVPPGLVDSIMKLEDPDGPAKTLQATLRDNNVEIAAYYIKIYDGEVSEYIIELDKAPGVGHRKYLTPGPHDFYIQSSGILPHAVPNVHLYIDNKDITTSKTTIYSLPQYKTGFLNMGTTTHAYIGALNLDGRFLTGDIVMTPYNYVFAVGYKAYNLLSEHGEEIREALANDGLPDLAGLYFQPGIYALQCLETTGQHVFAVSPRGQNRLYGLRLNNTLLKSTPK